jgi:hypothetical protein
MLVIVLFSIGMVASKAHAQTGIITVRGGNITMNITTGAAGSQPVAVTNTVTTLRYWKQAQIAKITVSTSCPTQAFNLQVVATGVTYGVAAPAVSLTNGMLAVDFITNIPRTGTWTRDEPTLQYTASATFAQGNSAELNNDLHTLTYTLLVQ